MARPGVQVTIRDSIPPRSQASDVDTWFVAGITERGPAVPTLVRSMTDFERLFGARVNYGELWDPIDAFFREGGSKTYIKRIYGENAVAAFLVLDDGTDDTVTVTARSPGAWGNSIEVAVIEGTTASDRRIQVFDADEVLLDQSPSFSTKSAMLEWVSDYVILTDADDLITDMPAVLAATSLASGDDDLSTVDDDSYIDGLDQFGSGLGAGQVSLPGTTDTDLHEAVLAHAASHNRVALLDAPDSSVVSTLTTHALTLRTGPNARYGGLFGPMAIVPGIVSGTLREIPFSAIQAAMISRQQNPNEPAAGSNGISRFALRVKYSFTDDQRETLNEAGVNIVREIYNTTRTYGYRTLVDPSDMPQWVQLNAVRAIMTIKAEAEVVGEEYIFKQIDGRGKRISAFQGALMGMLVPYYESGALYGQSPEEAFFVDCGNQVNTPETIADGQLRAVISVRTSPFGELVEIEIVKQPLPLTAGAPLA